MANKHRLPQYIIPHRYTILLKPNLTAFTFSGEETILLNVTKAAKTITLHAAELQISHAEIDNQKGKVSYNEKIETATITFSKSIGAGEKQLNLHFTGILNDKMRGFYRSKYEVSGDTLHMAVTQFESTDARRAFPCFDEPSMKAIFDVTLMVPSDHTAISNTMPVSEAVAEHETGYKLVQFSPTPKMSTYLLAFVVGKFESVEVKSEEGVLVRVFVTPGKKKQAEFAADTASKILSFYNNYFAIHYPLPVLDLIAIPDFAAGAMENWGAVTFRETALLVDPEHTSTASKQWVALVIAHELAHMWFGDLVTMEWWTHLWLNEGFACFIEYLAVDHLFPAWEIWKQFVATEHNSALSLDSLKNTHPIEVVVKHPSEISEIFDEVSYAKGASIIRMLFLYLGEKNFRDGLRYYLNQHAYANAKTEELWEALEHVSHKPIKQLMQYWTKRPGYPVLTITEKKDNIQITQQRFFSSILSGQQHKDSTIWHIPLHIKTDKGEKSLLMEKRTVTLPKASTWMKINANEASFTRVSYPTAMVQQFSNSVQNLTEIDKLGIIRDAFVLPEAGIGSVANALALAKTYTQERDYIVWAELGGNIHRIANLLAEDKTLYTKYSFFAKDIFSAIAAQMGWQKKSGEKHTDILLRSLALYGYGTYGDQATVTTAQHMFHQYITNQVPIDPDLRGVVYTIVAEYGTEKEYNQFLNLYVKESLHQEKDRLARALASFRDTLLIQKTLKWSLSGAVRSQDSPRILYAVFSNTYGREAAWDFLTNNWETYQSRYAGGHGFSRVIENVSVFTKTEKAEAVQAFFAAHPTPEINRTVKQVIEQINANAAYLAKDKGNIGTFLTTK